MTVSEAEAAWDEHILWVMNKLQQHGLEEPTQEALQCSKDTFIYEQLSGDFVPASEYNTWRNSPKARLAWWAQKLKQYRICNDPELNKYVIQKIQEARNGV